MKKNIIALMTFSTVLVSCIEPASVSKSSSGSKKSQEPIEEVDKSGVAAKNFAQINNTYASLTGVNMRVASSDYAAIKGQLPSTSNPSSLNGFNQIASTRLAFTYCENYIGSGSPYMAMDNTTAIKGLIDQFIDIKLDEGDHDQMLTQLKAIMNNDDALISDNNSTSKKEKLLHLTCTAILSSSYVTLI
jgi:hypothetical protein